MQRLALSLSSVLLLTASAAAQPAPVDPNAPPPPGEPAAAPQPEPAAVVEPPPPPKKEEAPLPKKVGVGTLSPGSFLTFGLNMQGWLVYDHSTKPGVGGADDIQSSASFFRVRRVELTLAGEIVPKFAKYRVMFDPARISEARTTTTAVNAAGAPVSISTPNGPFSPLQDAYITLSGQYLDVLIGQFKNPVSWDGFNSAAKMILPDRAFGISRFGGQRDVGVRVEKVFKKFAYYGGVFNGNGQNTTSDNNNQKDVALRVEVFPIPGLTIAGVTYDSVGYRTKAGTKDRWEGDLRFESGPFLFQGEFIRARDILADNADPVNSQAGYAAVGYTLKGVGAGGFKGDLQPMVRFGYYDPDADDKAPPTANNIARFDYEVGLNYYLRGHELKFQLAYDRQQYDDSDLRRAVDEVILATQVWY